MFRLLSMRSGCAGQPLRCLLLRPDGGGQGGRLHEHRKNEPTPKSQCHNVIMCILMTIPKMSGTDCPDRGEEDEALEAGAGGEWGGGCCGNTLSIVVVEYIPNSISTRCQMIFALHVHYNCITGDMERIKRVGRYKA